METTKVRVDPYEDDSAQLIRQLDCHKRLQVKTKRTWHGCLILAAMVFAIASTTISVVAIYKVLELSNIVTDLRANCHPCVVNSAEDRDPELAYDGEIDIDGEDSDSVEEDADEYGFDENSLEDSLDEDYYQSSSGEPWPTFSPDDEDHDLDSYDEDEEEEKEEGEAPVRERRAASGARNKKRHRGRDKGQTRTGRESNGCEFRVGRKDKALKGKEKCMNALGEFVKTKVDEVNPNAPMHLVANISLTSQEESVFKDNQSMFRAMEHGDMYYQGFVPRNETMEFWSTPDWIKSNEKSKNTYILHPAEGEVRAVEIKVTGLYMVYAQVTFHDTRAHMGYHVKKTSANQNAGHKVDVLSCIDGVDYVKNGGQPINTAKYRTCHTNGLHYFYEGDKIYMESIDPSLHIATKKTGFSFWGLIRVA